MKGLKLTDSEFNKKYKDIIEIVCTDFERLDAAISLSLEKQKENNSQILPIIKDFLSSKGKRIRPAMIFLFNRALKNETDDFCIKLAAANELMHNATLIHDDIIDCSLTRRGKKTINFDYDSKLAVLAGDFLLTMVLKLLFDIEDIRIRQIHTKALSKLIEGELHQYFSRYKLLSIDDYIEKSKDKTARLFEAGLLSVYYYKNENTDNAQDIRNFALNFGTGFQIMNDIAAVFDREKTDEDLKNGDYTAPYIYYLQDKYDGDISKIKNLKQLSKQLKNTDSIEKSKHLAKFYLNSAIENISFLDDNQYKRAIIDLCNLIAGK